MRRRSRIARLLVGLVLLVGCGRGDSGAAGSASAADELRTAAEATLASRSFVIRVNGVGAEKTIVYQAPDRVHTRGGPEDPEDIWIGRTLYTRLVSPPTPDGSELPEAFRKSSELFQRFEAPASGPGPIEGSLAELRALADATEIDRDGAGYRWRFGSGRSAVSGEAHIDKGRIARFTFEPKTPEWRPATYRISDYDAAPAIEAPPADRVVDAPAMVPCGPDGNPPPGQPMCTGGADPSDPTTTTTVALPTPTVTGRSPLELRRVMAVENGSCATLTAAYGAGEVRLDGPDGCYRLGTVLAVIRGAEARPEAGPSGVTVSLDLSPSDGAAVRSALSGQFQRQVAMVMFGRVLSAPVVQDPEPSVDSIAISPVDPQAAANIIHALAR